MVCCPAIKKIPLLKGFCIHIMSLAKIEVQHSSQAIDGLPYNIFNESEIWFYMFVLKKYFNRINEE